MEDNSPSKTRRWLILLLKITVTAVCLWYVSGKIDFKKTGQALQDVNWLFLLGAFVFFIISKLLSALRLNIYFSNIGLQLQNWQNIKLYWLGMFYNLFLPGSIGGDAYKVILLSKRFDKSYKKTTAAVLLDRISGLAGLGLILALYGVIVLKNKWYSFSIIAGALVAVYLLFIVIKKKFPGFLKSFTPTLFLGIAVQVMQVVCVYMIMLALNIRLDNTPYIFLFLVSSIVSVLPLTIGGLGIREVVFLEGAKYFGLIQETSILISLLFYIITLVTSAFGIFYVFRDPVKKNKDTSLRPYSEP